MSYALRPAVTSEAKPLIGIYSESGKGKTYSALLLACGFVGGDMRKVAMIETESGRGEAFARDAIVGGYMVRPIRNNFSPVEYGKAIQEVEQSDARVLILDSASHEWEGAGGVLSMAAQNQAEGKRGPLVWQMPKLQHQREFMLRLMQTPIPLVIVCMRAKYPMKEVPKKGKPNEKEWVRSDQLEPKQADDILFEMFVHGWLDDDHKFHGTKYTLDELRNVIKDDERISVESGRALAEWAAGGQSKPSAKTTGDAPEYITDEQAIALDARCAENGINVEALRKAAGVQRLSLIEAKDYERASAWIDAAIAKRKQAQAAERTPV